MTSVYRTETREDRKAASANLINAANMLLQKCQVREDAPRATKADRAGLKGEVKAGRITNTSTVRDGRLAPQQKSSKAEAASPADDTNWWAVSAGSFAPQPKVKKAVAPETPPRIKLARLREMRKAREDAECFQRGEEMRREAQEKRDKEQKELDRRAEVLARIEARKATKAGGVATTQASKSSRISIRSGSTSSTGFLAAPALPAVRETTVAPRASISSSVARTSSNTLSVPSFNHHVTPPRASRSSSSTSRSSALAIPVSYDHTPGSRTSRLSSTAASSSNLPVQYYGAPKLNSVLDWKPWQPAESKSKSVPTSYFNKEIQKNVVETPSLDIPIILITDTQCEILTTGRLPFEEEFLSDKERSDLAKRLIPGGEYYITSMSDMAPHERWPRQHDNLGGVYHDPWNRRGQGTSNKEILWYQSQTDTTLLQPPKWQYFQKGSRVCDVYPSSCVEKQWSPPSEEHDYEPLITAKNIRVKAAMERRLEESNDRYKHAGDISLSISELVALGIAAGHEDLLGVTDPSSANELHHPLKVAEETLLIDSIYEEECRKAKMDPNVSFESEEAIKALDGLTLDGYIVRNMTVKGTCVGDESLMRIDMGDIGDFSGWEGEIVNNDLWLPPKRILDGLTLTDLGARLRGLIKKGASGRDESLMIVDLMEKLGEYAAWENSC